MEIKVSDIAKQKMLEFTAAHNEEPILRIYVQSVGCSGARFGLAVDYINENDDITEVDGIKFVTDREYIPVYSNGISIDYVEKPKEGFIIKSLRPISTGCGGCTGCKR
jgi:HesB-like selenoprotein